MITINDIQYRNLEEQVLQNTELLNLLPTGISSPNFKGIFSSMDEVEANVGVGDIYLFGENAPYELFYYDNQLGIVSLGTFPRPGSKGEPGSEGPAGEKGETGVGWKTGTSEPIAAAADGTLYFDSNTNDIFEFRTGRWVRIGNIQGKPGIRGAQGKTGNTGPQGPKGDQGPAGPSGASYVIQGIVSTVSQLSGIQPLAGRAYLVGTENNYTLYLAIDGLWEPIGPITSNIPRPLPDLGNSRDDTMSQKAITDEFKYISRNIYETIAELYDYVPFTPDPIYENSYYYIDTATNEVRQTTSTLNMYKCYNLLGNLGQGFHIVGEHYYDAPLWIITDFDGKITRTDRAPNDSITHLDETIIFQEGETTIYVNYNGGTVIERSTLELASLKLGETSTTAFPGDKGKFAYDSSYALGGQANYYIRINFENEADDLQNIALIDNNGKLVVDTTSLYYRGHKHPVKAGEYYRIIGTTFNDCLGYAYTDTEGNIIKKPSISIGIFDEEFSITEDSYLYIIYDSNYAIFLRTKTAAGLVQPLNGVSISFIGDVSKEFVAIFNAQTGAKATAATGSYEEASIINIAQNIQSNPNYYSGKLGTISVIMSGITEWENSIPLGSFAANTYTDESLNLDSTQYYGALEIVIRHVLKYNKKVMAYTLIPPYQWYNKANSINQNYSSYWTATTNLANKYGLNNLNAQSIVNRQLFANQKTNFTSYSNYNRLSTKGIKDLAIAPLLDKLETLYRRDNPILWI